jgi:hypothetical protein
MMGMAQSRENFRMDLHQLAVKPAPSRKEISQSLQLAGKAEELRAHLKGKETLLAQERMNNQELKRDIGRIQDEAKIAQRKAALDFIARTAPRY